MATDRDGVGEHGGPELDREINAAGVLLTGAGILGVTALGMVLMGWLGGHFRDSLRARDLPMTAVEQQLQEEVVSSNELRRQREVRRFPELEWPLDVEVTPEPRPQVKPWEEMGEFRMEENHVLEDYGWIDRGAGIARVPVERAVDEVVEEGLPEFPPPPQEEEAGEGAVEVTGVPPGGGEG